MRQQRRWRPTPSAPAARRRGRWPRHVTVVVAATVCALCALAAFALRLLVFNGRNNITARWYVAEFLYAHGAWPFCTSLPPSALRMRVGMLPELMRSFGGAPVYEWEAAVARDCGTQCVLHHNAWCDVDAYVFEAYRAESDRGIAQWHAARARHPAARFVLVDHEPQAAARLELFSQCGMFDMAARGDVHVSYEPEAHVQLPIFCPTLRGIVASDVVDSSEHSPLPLAPLDTLLPTAGGRAHAVVALVSNCAASPAREAFLRELRDALARVGVPFDSYGACVNTRGAPPVPRMAHSWEHGAHALLSRYTFAVAAERHANTTYVSEKLFAPLIAGAVPVYWGSHLAAQWAPAQSYIDATVLGPRRRRSAARTARVAL